MFLNLHISNYLFANQYFREVFKFPPLEGDYGGGFIFKVLEFCFFEIFRIFSFRDMIFSLVSEKRWNMDDYGVSSNVVPTGR
jgi:hypothetical protein